LDRYIVSKKLGSGAYGHVWKVTDKSEKGKPKSYALKKIFEAFQHSTDAQRTFREISILSKISHKNIIKLHEIIASQNKRDVYLVF
jgi:mitogen-activated protein kinase 15